MRSGICSFVREAPGLAEVPLGRFLSSGLPAGRAYPVLPTVPAHGFVVMSYTQRTNFAAHFKLSQTNNHFDMWNWY